MPNLLATLLERSNPRVKMLFGFVTWRLVLLEKQERTDS